MHILAVNLVVGILVFLFCREQAVFKLFVERGKIVQCEGNISSNMKYDIEQAVSDVSKGEVIGRKSPHGVKLSFRGDIGEFTQQRLRNIVGIYQR